MSPEVIERTAAQRTDALVLANRIRMRRAEIKRQMAAGTLTATEVLENLERATDKMRALHLLMAIPKVGLVKARAAMRGMRIADSKTLGGMSDRQRAELIKYLGGR